MPINPSDVKLLESERMTDYEDGGGRRTSRVIPDNEPGNIFPKVSRLDSVYGRVNMRKVYGAIQTTDLDVYAGAHAIITDPPDNDLIHCLLFSTASDFDNRTAARDRIESYVVMGPETRMTLYGRQLIGQQAILAYQRVEDTLPEVGAVICLSNENGSGTVINQQYVRVQDVTHEVRAFTDTVNQASDFTRRVLSIKIGSVLRYEFNGPESPSRYSNVARLSRIRSTTVADAARYYGIVKLEEQADINDLVIKVDSVYAPIVPTTQRESAISLAEVGGASAIEAAGPVIIETTSRWASTGDSSKPLFLHRGVERKSLVITATGANWTLKDNALGSVYVSADPDSYFGANSVGLTVGTIDYPLGIITPNREWNGTTHAVRWTPAAETSQSAHSRSILMTLASRGTVFAESLLPLPSPGSLVVDFRALGKWYRLRDNGSGVLAGDDPAYGVGSIDYVTGALVMTLGAMPDVGSSVLLSWGTRALYTIRTGSRTAYVELRLPEGSVARNTVNLSYLQGGVSKIANDDGAGLLKNGAATIGLVNYTTGSIVMNVLVDNSSTVTATYGVGAPIQQLFTDPPRNSSGGTVTMQLSTVPVLPRSVELSWSTDVEVYDPATRRNPWLRDPVITVFDDGAGRLKMANGTDLGSVNYATGLVTIMPDVEVTIPVTNYGWVNISATQQQYQFLGYTYVPAAAFAQPDFDVTAKYRSTDAESTKNKVLAPILVLPLTPGYLDRVVEGSLLLSGAGEKYFDRNGVMYSDFDPLTGSGLVAGTVDYEERVAYLTSWTTGGSLAFTSQACLTTYGGWTAFRAFFRTAGSPIRSASLYIQATTADGSIITGTSNAGGTVLGTYMRGNVEQTMGVVAVEFGELVLAAGNESEPWYRTENLEGLYIWKPLAIDPSTLRYNCVAISSLPLNADILGLDPVRLPSDGKVPIFRSGDVSVVHAKGQTVLANPVVAGTTYNLSAANLAELWIMDASVPPKLIPVQRYSENLPLGRVTIAADFNAGLENFTNPLTVHHRIEDLVLLSDVQINGELALTAPLSRTYPVGSYVSSAMLFGDMNARVTNVFDQNTWDGTWSNGRIGSQATAEFNLIDYPFEILNNGGVTERWRINFTSTTAFQVIGENLGVIAVGSTTADCQPVNQLTSLPYFLIRKEGWGGGWAAGNQVRFNTLGATAPIWISRTILPGATLEGDSFMLQLRGDVDT